MDYAKIRDYLSAQGYESDRISRVFAQLDNEEIDFLYRQQRISNLRTYFIASLIIDVIAIIYTILRYPEDGLQPIILLPPLTLTAWTYMRYKKVSAETYTTSKILRENRKHLKTEK